MIRGPLTTTRLPREAPPALGDDAAEASVRPAGPGVGLAALAVGIVAMVFVVGLLGLALSGGSKPVPEPTGAVAVPGSGLPAGPGAAALAPISAGGQPPSDVVAALVVPRGSQVVAGSARDDSVQNYDRSVSVTSDASQAALLTFYRAELPALGWTGVTTTAGTGGATTVLAQHASDDGDYWELGLTVEPTTFSSANAGALDTGSTQVPATRFTFRLYVSPDQ